MTHGQPEEEVLLTPEVLSETMESLKGKLSKASEHLDLMKRMFPFLEKESEKKAALKKRRTLEAEVRMLEAAYKTKSDKTDEVLTPVGGDGTTDDNTQATPEKPLQRTDTTLK